MSKKATVYTSPICMECEKAKRFFKEKGIEVEEIDTFEHKEKAKEIFEKTGQKRIPTIEIDGEYYTGFDKEKIEEALKE